MNIISLETDVTLNKDGVKDYTITEKIQVNRSGFVQILTTSSRVEETRKEELFIRPSIVFELFNYFNSFSYEAFSNADYKNGIWMLCLTFSDGSKRVLSGEVKDNQKLNVASDALRKLLQKPYLIAFDNKNRTEKFKTFTISLTEGDEEIEKVIFIESERKLKLYKKEGKKEVFIEYKLDLWEIEKLRSCIWDELFFDYVPPNEEALFDISFSFSFLLHSDINVKLPYSYSCFYGPYYAFIYKLKEITKETNRFIIFSSLALYFNKNHYVYLDVTFPNSDKKYRYVSKDLLIKEGENVYISKNNELINVNVKQVESGLISESKYPFINLEAIDSTFYRDYCFPIKFDKDKALDNYFAAFVNYKECSNNGYILVNALSKIINCAQNCFVPTDTSDMSDYHSSSYLLIEDNSNHILPCIFDENDNIFSNCPSFSMMPFIDYLHLILDSPGINAGMITRKNESLILTKELIKYSLTWKPISVITAGSYKVEKLKVDVIVLVNKEKESGFRAARGQMYYYISDQESAECAMKLFDDISFAGFYSLYYSPQNKDDAIYKLSNTWKALNKERCLDMYFGIFE